MATLPAQVHNAAHHRADLRRWPRMSVALHGTVTTPHGQRGVRIHNLGPGGALVELGMAIQAGTEVIFQCGGISAEGMVLWQRPQRCGIWFYVPIDDGALERQLTRTGVAPLPRSARPQTRQAWRSAH